MADAWPMVGRDAELVAITSGLRRQLGSVVVGTAGVGKSMLAREAGRRLEAAGWRTVTVLGAASVEFPLQAFAGTLADRGPDLPDAVHRLRRKVAGRTVLLLDDAHLLDVASAELVWQLASAGDVLVVATVRSGHDTPEHVRRLWSDGLCDQIELAPLSDAEIGELVERVLGGQVDPRLPRLLTRRAGGNGLLVRELLRSGRASGAIVFSHHVWRLVGELPIGSGLLELISGGLRGLADEELRAARLLAVGEPLRLRVVEAAIGPELLESLEDRRIIRLQETIDGPVITLAHPLYAEALRAGIRPLRLRRLRLELIKAIRRAGPPSAQDLLRSAVWRLELGEETQATELLEAARLAGSLDHPTAVRLARAAVAAGGGVGATVLLGESLTMQGRVERVPETGRPWAPRPPGRAGGDGVLSQPAARAFFRAPRSGVVFPLP